LTLFPPFNPVPFPPVLPFWCDTPKHPVSNLASFSPLFFFPKPSPLPSPKVVSCPCLIADHFLIIHEYHPPSTHTPFPYPPSISPFFSLFFYRFPPLSQFFWLVTSVVRQRLLLFPLSEFRFRPGDLTRTVNRCRALVFPYEDLPHILRHIFPAGTRSTRPSSFFFTSPCTRVPLLPFSDWSVTF